MRCDCIWYGRCSDKCSEACEDYTAVDDTGREEFYQEDLSERVSEYEKVVGDFTDGRNDE